ncbi:MAG: hypothetical protein O7A63_06255 [Acidobacteria bacterium]|nr:hypothetical protein [Acidobacteriota bacterium]
MRARRRLGNGWMVAGAFGLALLASGGTVSSGEQSSENQGDLYIATDRVVGFVPLKVYVYGRIRSGTPARIELCRSEVRSIMADTRRRPDARRDAIRSIRGETSRPATSCTAARLVETPNGYDHAYEMRFDRPGTYQVRLMMTDQSGRRSMSNTVQVRAF